MKTFVSLPNELFQRAEAQAKRLRISRSQLYAQALADFLARFDSQAVANQLNQFYLNARAELDSELQRAQIDLLQQVQW